MSGRRKVCGQCVASAFQSTSKISERTADTIAEEEQERLLASLELELAVRQDSQTLVVSKSARRMAERDLPAAIGLNGGGVGDNVDTGGVSLPDGFVENSTDERLHATENECVKVVFACEG